MNSFSANILAFFEIKLYCWITWSWNSNILISIPRYHSLVWFKDTEATWPKKLAKDSSTIFFFTAVATYTAYEATLKIFLKSYSNFGETIKENLSV